MKRARILIVALLVAVLVMLSIGPMTASAAGPVCATYHYVYPGQNLFRIALQYGVSVQAIAQANGIWNVNYVRAGTTLCIPGPIGADPGPCRWVHVVRWGENLSSISRWYGVSMWGIARANGIYNLNYIRAGQRLCIP
jgi:spore germination protein YaaH